MESKDEVDQLREKEIDDMSEFLTELRLIMTYYYATSVIVFSWSIYVILGYIVCYFRQISIWCELMLRMIPFRLLHKNPAAEFIIFKETQPK